ncbi:transcriptional regulator, AraC family [Caldicellulosiruptor saccharolyticus DSM 8903]|uniref:Transcriptional regulator, AraC family n=1 Tax=Caldicellulosiruptor saccharolyticus (strain ATCC 43494 / DSM 8903 / Tp8T 6331) TaxID=351627 RepID=A4XJ70_CALS8|nr:AraC family transcriptional regulator [Caldicellulosiruptor saccharolyticus]ABP66955.1 transcriptional regulator, AraC family [Caldicellulosiruptor saccharolyticus DSM 8903]
MDERLRLKEKVQHGSAVFPINVYEKIFVHENNTLLPHWHDEFEIVYLEKGTASFRVDGKEYFLGPKQFLFVNCGSIHGGKAEDNPEPYAIVFSLSMLFSEGPDICKSKYLQSVSERKLLVQNSFEDEHTRELISNIITVWKEKPKGYELLVKGYLFVIFYYLFNKRYVTASSTDRELDLKLEKIKSALDFINSNYSSDIDIDLLAKLANLSKFYFCRLFKEITHLTPVDYINKFRVEKAIELIKNTNLSISEIAFEVGFNNVSYFIKVFKEYVGVTPFKYKKNVLC